MTFVVICLQELSDDIEEKIRYNSLSSRLSQLEADEFAKFMQEIEPKSSKPKKVVVDHLSQMKQAKG